MTTGGWVIAYLALTLLVGLAATRWVRGLSDFLSAGRQLPFLLSSFALFAFWFGSETVFGASSEFIQHGLLGVIEDPFGGFLCLTLFALIFVRPLYRQNIFTLGDLFRKAYGRRIELISSLVMLLTFLGYIAAQIIALSILFDILFGLSPTTGRILAATIVTLYTTAGGMWAVSITDFLQSIVIVVGLILLAVFFTAQVDSSLIWQAPKPHFFDFVPTRANGHSWLDYLAAWLTLGLGSLASQDIFQRANAAKSEKIAVRSTHFGAWMYLLFAMLPLYLGLVSLHLAPELTQGDTQYTLLSLVSGYAPQWLQVLFMGALVSAIFSTSSGALLAPASILSQNLIRPLLMPNAGEKQMLLFSRISVVVMGLIATWLSLISDSIYDLVAESSILGMVSILVPMFCALFLRPSRLGCLLSMGLGLVGYVAFEYLLPPVAVPSMFVGFGCSILGMVLGNFLRRWGWKVAWLE